MTGNNNGKIQFLEKLVKGKFNFPWKMAVIFPTCDEKFSTKDHLKIQKWSKWCLGVRNGVPDVLGDQTGRGGGDHVAESHLVGPSPEHPGREDQYWVCGWAGREKNGP